MFITACSNKKQFKELPLLHSCILDLISNQVLSDELNEEQASALINEVTNLIDTITHTVVKLRANLLEVAAVLRMANNSVSDASTSTMEGLFAAATTIPYTSLAQLTKEIASSKVGAEKTKKISAAKNISDFGYNCLLSEFYEF